VDNTLSSRAVPLSLFVHYADTAYSRLLKQQILIMRPIIREIRLVKLFVSEE